MDKESIYTSTGIKYHRAYQVFESLRQGIGRPQSLQVSLTNKCNLSCVFCSVAERELKQEWGYLDLCKVIQSFIKQGIKTIEFSGGGEPTLYPNFGAITHFAKGLGLRLGLITNGLKLKDISKHILVCYDWIRISMVALDYQDEIELPESFPSNVTLGMSYVVGQKIYENNHRKYKESDVLNRIKDYAKRYNVSYVRIVPDCMSDENEMNQIYEYYESLFNALGHPFFFQHKRLLQAKCCYMDAIKPWADADGYIYPCNSIPLLSDANRYFNPKYRLCHWTEIENYYKNRGNKSLNIMTCDRCAFTKNNEIIENMIAPIIHEEFI